MCLCLRWRRLMPECAPAAGLMRVEEARARLAERGVRVSRAQFYRLIRAGKVPTVEIGRLYVVDPDAWVDRLTEAAIESVGQPARARRAVSVTPVSSVLPPVRRPRFGAGA